MIDAEPRELEDVEPEFSDDELCKGGPRKLGDRARVVAVRAVRRAPGPHPKAKANPEPAPVVEVLPPPAERAGPPLPPPDDAPPGPPAVAAVAPAVGAIDIPPVPVVEGELKRPRGPNRNG